MAVDGKVYVAAGVMIALDPTERSAEPKVLWKEPTVQRGAASALAAAGKLYAINRGGVLLCASLEDGEVLSRTRLTGSFWSTPALAGQRLFACSYEGSVQVVELSADGREAKVAATVELGEPVQSSPAIAHGALFDRSDKHLFRLGK